MQIVTVTKFVAFRVFLVLGLALIQYLVFRHFLFWCILTLQPDRDQFAGDFSKGLAQSVLVPTIGLISLMVFTKHRRRAIILITCLVAAWFAYLNVYRGISLEMLLSACTVVFPLIVSLVICIVIADWCLSKLQSKVSGENGT